MTAEVIIPHEAPSQPTTTVSAETNGGPHLSTEEAESTKKSDTAKDIPILLEEPKPWKYNLPEIQLVDRHVDEPRKLRVAVIGAGLSGVTAGVLLPAKVPGIELTIFDKNADVVSRPFLRNNIDSCTDYISFSQGWHVVRECVSRSEVRRAGPRLSKLI